MSQESLTEEKPRAVEDGRAVQRDIVIAASPERVFDAWANPEDVARWYVQRQVGDPRKDDRLVWYISKDDLGTEGEALAVREATRGRRLLLENVGKEPWRGAIVQVDFAAEGTGTRVTVSQSRFFEALRDHVPNVDAGWACVLAVLKEYLEHHAGRDRHGAATGRRLSVRPEAVAPLLASADAIEQWAGERPQRMLATTPQGAVVAFGGLPGVFTIMGVGGAFVWYSGWDEALVEAARGKAEDLSERLAAALTGT